jgi:hypothetical protein
VNPCSHPPRAPRFTIPIWLQVPILGDLNDDGTVDHFDIPIFVGALLNPDDAAKYHRFAADLNQADPPRDRDMPVRSGRYSEATRSLSERRSRSSCVQHELS